MDIIVRGSVGDIKAPKYSVSKKVNDVERCGMSCMKAYIRALQKKQIRFVRRRSENENNLKKQILLKEKRRTFIND